MRLPGRGVVLADPAFLIAELVEPAQHLQVPIVPFLQPALRRMRRHREISEFHGAYLSLLFPRASFVGVRASFVSQCLRCGRIMTGIIAMLRQIRCVAWTQR